MKVILYMAITINGLIAKENGDSDWVSEEDTEQFIKKCRETGAVIMGRHTYDILYPNDLPLKQGIHVVLTKNKSLISDKPTVIFTDKTLKDILSMLEEKGYKEACIIGGSQTVSQFVAQGLVDEVYLDVEPLFFGKGIPLIKDADFEYKLKLLELKKLNENTVQLHYKIEK
ncbi:MAG TPA: dihydrofolate reductase family protein [Candidatus Nitrosocosmicus sp.]|nr:dihydrofolate reductase family protein [Candidatus Nitrosocosmicus sp.]